METLRYRYSPCGFLKGLANGVAVALKLLFCYGRMRQQHNTRFAKLASNGQALFGSPACFIKGFFKINFAASALKCRIALRNYVLDDPVSRPIGSKPFLFNVCILPVIGMSEPGAWIRYTDRIWFRNFRAASEIQVDVRDYIQRPSFSRDLYKTTSGSTILRHWWSPYRLPRQWS